MDHEHPFSPWQEWKITEKLGEGSYGKVYKAQRTEQGRSFYSAMKIIPIPSSPGELSGVRLEMKDEDTVRAYFKNIVDECIQEISTMEYFRGNSHIVSVEDFKVLEYLDEIGWDIYIRMEYLTSFLDYCTGRSLTEREIIKLGIDLCKALEYCGQLRIIHRDIKPENIFVSRFGDFKLGDFGIARELERSMSSLSKKGTFSYMAPEMYRGEAYDSSVDIYSLGIVLYKLMNRNRLPFMNLEKQLITYRDKENALNRRMAGELLPKPADASEELSEIILRACAFDVRRRYQDPEMMRVDLERLRRGEYIAGSPAKAVGYADSTTPPGWKENPAPPLQLPPGMHAKDENRDSDTDSSPDTEESPVTAEAGGVPEGTAPAGDASAPSSEESGQTETSSEGSGQVPPVQDTVQENAEQSGKSNLFGFFTSGERTSAPSSDSSENAGEDEDGDEPVIRHLPLWLIILVLTSAAVITVSVMVIIRWLNQPEQPEQPEQIVTVLENNDSGTAQIDDFSTAIQTIKDQATTIVEILPICKEEGDPEENVRYYDSEDVLIKAQIYPAKSQSGKCEEYYYWDEKLFFVYIWDENSDELLYYDPDGNLIRWVDTEGHAHDLQTENPEYVTREERYKEIAKEQLALAR